MGLPEWQRVQQRPIDFLSRAFPDLKSTKNWIQDGSSGQVGSSQTSFPSWKVGFKWNLVG